MSSSVSAFCVRLSMVPNVRASMKRTCPRRSRRCLPPPTAFPDLSRAMNHKVAVERVGGVVAKVGFDAPNRKVHLGEPPGRMVGLLPEDRDVAEPPPVRPDELLGLDEHPA